MGLLDDDKSLANGATRIAILGLLFIGGAGLFGAFLSLEFGGFLETALMLTTSALAFGLLLNALLRN